MQIKESPNNKTYDVALGLGSSPEFRLGRISKNEWHISSEFR